VVSVGVVGAVAVVAVAVAVVVLLRFPLVFELGYGCGGAVPALAGGLGRGAPPSGGGGFRTNRHLLAMSALMSASAYFRLLPPRPATCSSIALFPFVVRLSSRRYNIYMLPLCAFQSLLGERRSIQGRLLSFCWCQAI
jgi:hypothetical protein